MSLAERYAAGGACPPCACEEEPACMVLVAAGGAMTPC